MIASDRRREWRWWSRRADARVDRFPSPTTTPESALATLQLRRLVAARLEWHLRRRPELAAVVATLTGELAYGEMDRSAYRMSEALRGRLRRDTELQRLWREHTGA